MQLWQHPNGTFYILHGTRLRSRLSTRTKDRREAEIFLSRFIAADTGLTSEAPTVAAILTGYKKDRLPAVRGVEVLEYAVKVLTEHLGDLQPAQLTPPTLQTYTRKRGVAPGTILREVGVLRAALAWAVENQWITVKPIISNPVKTPPPRDRWITKDEARKLLAACVEPHVRMFIQMGLMTAARMSAILEAKWDQVDWDRKTINFGAGHGNKRRAIAPLNPELERVLKAWREFNGGDSIIEWRGEPVATIKNGFRKACLRAGLKGVSPHVLRHSAATWMAEGGVPLGEIAKMLGDSEKTVEKVYAKHTPEYLRRAAGALQLD
jgi:integrase